MDTHTDAHTHTDWPLAMSAKAAAAKPLAPGHGSAHLSFLHLLMYV